MCFSPKLTEKIDRLQTIGEELLEQIELNRSIPKELRETYRRLEGRMKREEFLQLVQTLGHRVKAYNATTVPGTGRWPIKFLGGDTILEDMGPAMVDVWLEVIPE